MKFFATLLILASMIFAMTGCNKEKALKTVRDGEELAGKMLIYGRNIAAANNESFRQGNISADLHLFTNRAADAYQKGLDIYVKGIAAAKKAISEGASASSQLDILERLFNAEVVQAALTLVDAVAKLPAGVADRIAGWAAAIQLALVSFKALIAETRSMTNAEGNHV